MPSGKRLSVLVEYSPSLYHRGKRFLVPGVNPNSNPSIPARSVPFSVVYCSHGLLVLEDRVSSVLSIVIRWYGYGRHRTCRRKKRRQNDLIGF